MGTVVPCIQVHLAGSSAEAYDVEHYAYIARCGVLRAAVTNCPRPQLAIGVMCLPGRPEEAHDLVLSENYDWKLSIMQEHLSKIKALEMEKAESLEKQWELQEEVEMLKGVVTAVSDEKEELQEEVAMLKVVLNSVSLEKEELEEEVEMLKNALRSVASEREQHLLRIRALEMELEEHSEQQRTLEEEVEMMRSEQYVLRIQVQEFY